MGKVVLPKHTADLKEIIAALKIYYEANGAWVTNTEHTRQLKGLIGGDQYPSSYPKKAQFLTYYGFTEWNPAVDSERRITSRGKVFYDAYIGNKKEVVWETIAEALENMTFGRNNNGVGSSDSDVEPPCLLVRAILDLDYLINREYSFLLWRLAEGGGNYTDVKEEIRNKRMLGVPDYPEDCKQPAYSDLKIILFLTRLDFLQESTAPDGKKCIVLNPAVKEKYGSRFANLKIYNVDKDTFHENGAQKGDGDFMTENAFDDPKRTKGGTNILLYGVPGCGKSHEIKSKYCNDKKYMERVVFHPDYTYSDFVGQILPKTDGTVISYPFTAGPFTTILRKAICDPEHMYFLVIEEINRGNAPAIFGEVFQLLDREEGTSEYGINNFDIAKCVYGEGKEEEEIKIPSNLTILATMNTADQNVFTLDTAFKRRWSMRNIENNISACKHANHQICGTAVTWGLFATKINDLIIDIGEGNLSSEDNRLGAHFVKAEELCDEQRFAEKVLMYLWNDAFKYDHDKVFKPEYRTLEELLKGFYTHKFGIFASALGFDTIAVSSAVAGELSENEYLDNKNSEMIELYRTIRDLVQQQVPDLRTYTTGSKQYIGMGAEDIKRKSFAEFSLKKDFITIELEKPTDASLQSVGEELQYTGNHDHYFRVIVTKESNAKLIAAAIFDSYKQLKKGN